MVETTMLAGMRLIAFLVVAPPFHVKAFPGPVKVALALGLALVAGPRASEASGAIPGTMLASGSMQFLGALLLELVVGLGLGFLVRMVFAGVQAAGSIIQVGTQLRSFPGVVGARELMKSGVLGKIMRIDESRNGEKPYWYQYLGKDIKKEDVDWNEFLGDTPKQAFDARKLSAWYGYYEFCQGPVPQWGAHFLDLMHYVMDCGLPESCMCIGGSTYWNDENKFTTPDNVIATWMYPEGFMVTSSNNFGNGSGNTRKFFGDKGTLAVDNWNAPTYSAEGGGKRDGKIRGKMEVTPIPRPDHFRNWLDCMRDNQTPHASIDAGYQHAVAVLMAVMSYDTGKKTIYDPKQRKITTA